jgi:hypothetical protein
MDAVGGDFDFGNATEGKQELYEVLGRLFRSLLHDVADSIGDRGLEHHALGLQASQVHAHELARLQHDSKIVALRAVKCKRSPTRFPGWNKETLRDGSLDPVGTSSDPPLQGGAHPIISVRVTSRG